jgi:hypothetical protein
MCSILALPAGSIKGCIVMHPFFGYMQRMGFYDVEMRSSHKLIADINLPGTYLTYMSTSTTVRPGLCPLKEFLEKRHHVPMLDMRNMGVLTHLTTYDRHMTEQEVVSRGYPLVKDKSKTIHYLNISHVTAIVYPLEVRVVYPNIRTRQITHVRRKLCIE